MDFDSGSTGGNRPALAIFFVSIVVSALLAAASGCADRPDSGVSIPEIDVSALGGRARALVARRLEAARNNPQDAEAAGRAAMALQAFEFREAALELYRRAAATAPDEFRWRYLRGLAASDLGLLAEAEDAFRSAAHSAAGEPSAWLRLAAVMLDGGRPADALAIYDRLAASEPASMAVHYGRGRALAGLGRGAEAVAALERAAGLADDYRPLYYQLALALRSLGREDEAARFLALYERLQPSLQPPFADPLLRQVEELREGSYLRHLNRGMRLEAAGRPKEALPEYLRAVDADPAQVHARVNLIGVYAKLGRRAEAENAYRAALAAAPDTAEAHFNYGVLLSQSGEHGKAEAAYRAALEVNPYLADARVNLGDALERQGRTQAAGEHYRRVLRHNPGYRLARFRLGTMLYGQGRRAEALQHLRAAAAADDEQTPQYLIVLARVERAMGRGREAAQHASKARRLALRFDRADVLAVLDREFPARE